MQHAKNTFLLLAGFLFSGLLHAQTASQNSLNFDGSDDYIQTGYIGIAGSAARTVEAWIKTTANADPNNGGVQKVITDWGSMATGTRFTFNVLYNNAIRIEVGGSGLSSKTSINDGYWHHVAAVFNPTATNKYSLYVDGVLDTSGNITTTINTASSAPLLIGKRNDNNNFFNGSIDEVRVWNYAKTQNELDSLKDEELCPNASGLVAYYRFNQGNAASTNTSVTTLNSALATAANGSLYNFTLGGSSSNWVSGAPITLAPNTDTSYSVSACGSYTSPGGQYVTFSRTVVDKYTNSLGCDSNITINVTIKSRSFVSENISGCDSILSNDGVTYWTNSGTFQNTYTNVNGCDSIHQSVVTINKSVTNNISATNCETYTSPSGKYTWTTSGNYTDTLQTVNGCDSVLAINLTINNVTTGEITPSVCNSFTSPTGKMLTISGTYLDTLIAANSCDSILTINLTILEPTDTTIYAAACDSFITESGQYTWKNSGIYTEKLINTEGCDSTITYNLTINFPKKAAVPFLVNACNYYVNPYGGDTIFTTSSREITSSTVAGCDSTFTMNVTIGDAKVNVSQVGHKLTATKRGDLHYQWFNCDNNTEFANDTNNTFEFWDNGPKMWGVATRSFVNNCTDTVCITPKDASSIGEISSKDKLKVWPNPANNSVLLQTDLGNVEFIITNQLGEIVNAGSFNTTIKINTSELQNGVYIITAFTKDKFVSTRLLILH